MKVFIDVSVLTLATFVTGIQRVTREITVRLIDGGDFEVVLLHYNGAEDVYYRIDNQAFVNYYIRHKGVKEKMITKERVPLSKICGGTVFFDLDAAWMCRMKRSYLLPVLKGQGARIVAHIYDIISVTHPQYCLQRGVYNFMDYIGAHLQYGDEMIVNAHATRDELYRLCARLGCCLPPCAVVPLGADFHESGEVGVAEVRQDVADAVSGKPYILMVGTIEPRKNHRLLLEAYDRGLKALGYRIIFAGYMGWNMEAFSERLHSHPDYGQGLYHFEGLDDKAISCLYRKAKFLAFCSYTEGFGLPIIEAVQRGTPVIAADIPVSREVAGDCCVWFEQDNAEELCEKIRFYDENTADYERLKQESSQRGFGGWESCYKGMAAVKDNNAA